MSTPDPQTADLLTPPQAMAVTAEPGGADGGPVVVHGTVHHGYDVFGIPHGGFLAGLAGNAVLAATGSPDLYSITVHYLRKAAFGPMRFEVHPLGGSRRFTSVRATAHQDDEVVMAVMASVGDRTGIEGPGWTDRPFAALDPAGLTPPADVMTEPFTPPAVAQRVGLQLSTEDVAFARQQHGDGARLRGTLRAPAADQAVALLACDVTPPAVWNALGPKGWVPTVELTAHVRARPQGDRLHVRAETHEVADGFLEEDAWVHDDRGVLVVQSRQLARWTSAG